MTEPLSDELAGAARAVALVRAELAKVILGQDAVVEQILVTLLCGGHALLEGVPGVAKTLTIRALAAALSCRVKRIQFTPDLMPSDIIGTNVFDLSNSAFRLHAGPIFTDLLLADEINRAPAKTQAALLEAMGERHATIDGVRHELSPVFTVFATQNPVEFEGTYALPEAQQDRFLLKVTVPYPPADAERAVLDMVHRGQPPDRLESASIAPVLTADDLRRIRDSLHHVKVEPPVIDYLLKIVRATRENDAVLVGASPRGSIFLLNAAKARALLHGRDYVTPDDVIAMAEPVLGHRMTLTADAEIAGQTRGEVLRAIAEQIEVPRVTVPGRLTLLAAGALALLLVAAIVAPPFVIPAVLLCDAALVAVCLWQGRLLRRLPVDVAPDAPGKLQVGRNELLSYVISNRSTRDVVVHLRQPFPAGVTSDQDRFEVRVAAGEVVRAALPATPRARGALTLPPAITDVRFPRDLARVRRVTQPTDLTVLPSLRGLADFEALRRQHASNLPGLHRQRQLGSGREFDQLRDYTPDDDFRDVNWKATARHRRPITNVYQAERSRDLLLCLDCGRMMGNPVEGATALDHAVDASIMLAHVANRQGDRAGLALFRDVVTRFVKPAAGTPAVHRIIDELAAARTEPVFPSYAALVAALRAYQPHRALVFLFTDLNDPQLAANLADVLPSVSRRHALVVVSLRDPLLDRVAAGPAADRRDLYEILAARQLAAERAARTRELRRFGATVVEADAGSLTVRLLNAYLALKARQLA